MKMILVWAWTNDWAGHLNGEATKDTTLAHVASSMDEAEKFMREHRDFCGMDGPPWHWCVETWPVDVDVFSSSDWVTHDNQHFTLDLESCDHNGIKEVDDDVDTDDEDDFRPRCGATDIFNCCCEEDDDDLLDVEDECACESSGNKPEDEQESEEVAERPRGHFLVRHEEGKLPSVDLDEIEQAYVEQAEDEAREQFTEFANKIADRMNELANLALNICEELRDEFPAK